jgi:hypothetical protein
MNIGTKSLLFGVHQFIWHPITVALAFRKLYGRWPNWKEAICIFCHDLGYWGMPNMDGKEGKEHPFFGAALAGRTIARILWLSGKTKYQAYAEGRWYFRWTAAHSTAFAKQMSFGVSELYYADKACVLHEPRWFYLLRAKASGEVWEYVDVALKSHVWSPEWEVFFGMQPRATQARLWHNWYKNKTRLRIKNYERNK